MSLRVEGFGSAETPLLPEFDTEVTRIFEMVMSQGQSGPSEADKVKNMLLFHSLRSFTCLTKTGATAADVLYEAITKNQPRIVASMVSKVAQNELGRAFTLACAHGRLEMVQMMAESVDPADLGEGFRIVCDFGHSDIVAELKHHRKITQTDADEGYLVAYRESSDPKSRVRSNTVMEIIGEKASSAGIGKVFIQACRDGRKDVALKLVQDRRLKIADLHHGLETASFELPLSSTTKAQLYFYRHRKQFVLAGFFVAAALSGIFSSRSRGSLNTVRNLDPFFAQRCCSLT